MWEYFTDPQMWPVERLFFELYAHMLFGRPGAEEFFEASVEAWITALAAERVSAGGDEATARTQGRLGLAVARGLLLDLLATGDRDGVTQAYELFLQYVQPPAPPGERA